MFGHLFYLFRFAGIVVYADISLVILLAIRLYPALTTMNPGLALDVILFSVLIFGSIALHEFGHSLTAIRLHYNVPMIILNILGGAALIGSSPRTARHEFLIAIAGPLVSIAIGFAGLFAWPYIYAVGLPDTALLVRDVAIINFFLAVFNLVPAFPLDGGRVFRSMLTPRLGLLKATEIAARVGQSVAIFIGSYSVLRMLSSAGMIRKFDPISVLGLPIEGGPILLMIAVFIYISANREYHLVLQEHHERGFRWADSSFREGDGDSWRRNTGDISKDVEVGPPPFDRDSGRFKAVRRLFRRLFKR